MFGWRRRSEGFEWREYVRTTVLVRRAGRQRKIDDVRVAAVNKVKDTADRGVAAGRAGVEQVAQTTGQIIKAAASATFQVVKSTALTTFQILKAAALVVCDALTGVARALWQIARSVGSGVAERLPPMPRPSISLPTLSFPSLPKFKHSADNSSASDGQHLRPDVGFKWPIRPNIVGGAAFAIALIVIVGPMLNSESALTTAKFVPSAAIERESSREQAAESAAQTSGDAIITGRATALSGDQLRINGRVIQLTGIETPEAAQRCLTDTGRSWSCGTSARDALDRLVRRKFVACTPAGATESGATLASCSVGDIDLAADLVSNGHVFAASELFAAYGSIENDARAAKLGLWQGDAKRPAEWRTDIWEDAKRAAPDGCPIKGRAAQRVYSMPWSKEYESRRMRTVRGDRWFCSEEEAQAAGFKPASRS